MILWINGARFWDSEIVSSALTQASIALSYGLPTTEAIDEGRPDRADDDAVVAIVDSRPFLRECIGRSMQAALLAPVVTYSALSELVRNPSARLVVLSLIEATSEECATA